MQILRTHWRKLVGPSSLTWGQRYHFVAGWLPWWGDALHLLFTVAAISWTIAILTAPAVFGFPIALFILPLTVFFAGRLLLGPLLYSRRVRCGVADTAGAALAGMGLSHVIARGVFAGLFGRRSVFEITRKRSADHSSTLTQPEQQVKTTAEPAPSLFAAVREEIFLFSGLVACVLVLLVSRPATSAPGLDALWMWIAVLMMQALPYAAAIGCACISFIGQPKPYQRHQAPAVAEHKAH